MPLRFCEQSDLERRLSLLGVVLYSDDTKGAEESVAEAVDECIEQASVDVSIYLARYDPSSLLNSDWVRLKTAVIAVWWLCGRRGQSRPEGVQKEYDETLQTLQLVAKGGINLPGIALAAGSAPAIIHRRVNPQLKPHVRVDTTTTNRDAKGYRRHNDPTQGGLFPS